MSRFKYAIYTGLMAAALVTVMQSKAYADKPTQSFVQAASIGNQFEISSSQLALQNSQNDDVKKFAQHMLDDHTKVAADMKTVISTTSPDNTQQPSPALDSKHQKMLDELNGKTGNDFDKLYVKDQVAAHKDAVSLFRDYSRHGTDDKLKSFATTNLPTLKQHYDAVKQLQSGM